SNHPSAAQDQLWVLKHNMVRLQEGVYISWTHHHTVTRVSRLDGDAVSPGTFCSTQTFVSVHTELKTTQNFWESHYSTTEWINR
ncbi:hypothetical protein V4Y02_23850, partial [Escherichia coli]